MTIPELFVLSNQALGKVVAQIKDDQWQEAAPPFTSWRPNQKLWDLVNYHSYDDICVPDVLAGMSKAEWTAKHPMDKDLLGDDPLGNYAKYNGAAIVAVERAKDLSGTAHLSYGDFPASEYLQHITLFRGLRTYDIANMIGADSTLPAELAQGLYDYVTVNEQMLRDNKIISPAVEVPADASVQDKLLAFTGRQP